MRLTPLRTTHIRLGATFLDGVGWGIPLRFGGPVREYEAAVNAAAVLDRFPIGRLWARGKDTLDLLNRLSTNKVDGVGQGEGIGTILTTNKGRIVDVIVVSVVDNECLLLTSPGQERTVLEWIEQYIFLEECEVTDITRRTTSIGVIGPKSTDLLARTCGESIAQLEIWQNSKVVIRGVEVVVVRTDALGLKGYDLITPSTRSRGVWRTLISCGKDMGVEPMGHEALEMIRVERAIGLHGHEYGEAYNPLEAQLTDLVSFTKGCYIGQEVVARLNTYKKVQRFLMKLEIQSDIMPKPGAAVHVGHEIVGSITSVAHPPGALNPLALAYIRKKHAVPATAFQVDMGARTLPAIACD